MTTTLTAELRSGQSLRLRCEQMVHGGLCVARADQGVTVLVAGAIPGETVDALLRFRKGRTWFADTVAAPQPSPHRVSAPCRYVPECGGCQLQHVDYGHQLELKRDIVRDALRRAGVAAPAHIATDGMDEPWRYRWRGEFHVVRGAHGADEAGLGFNRARSWRPIAVDDCLIHARPMTDALPALREFVRMGGSAALSTLQLTLGEDGSELLVRPKPRNALAPGSLEEAAMRLPAGQRLSVDATSLSWRGHVYRITPETFIQVNHAQMDALYERVIGALGDVSGRHVVDAYAGVGVLAVHLASLGASVTCIESNRATATMGVLNARLNGVEGSVRYEQAAVETVLPPLSQRAVVDALVLDPPRAGCASSVTAWMALAGPAHVAYVSCDPATLARDLHVLVASGPYQLDTLTIVDMFPQTYHVECVAVLRREDASRPNPAG